MLNRVGFPCQAKYQSTSLKISTNIFNFSFHIADPHVDGVIWYE